MLWLLATLSGVSISWGIAHRLKAGSQRLIALASDARVARQPPLRGSSFTETEERPATPRTGRTPAENPELRHNTHKENNA